MRKLIIAFSLAIAVGLGIHAYKAWAANDLNSDVLKVDTGAPIVVTAATTTISAIVWTGKGTAGDDLEVLDKAGGDTLFQAVAPTANYTIILQLDNLLHAGGVYVNVLDSGTVYFYR